MLPIDLCLELGGTYPLVGKKKNPGRCLFKYKNSTSYLNFIFHSTCSCDIFYFKESCILIGLRGFWLITQDADFSKTFGVRKKLKDHSHFIQEKKVHMYAKFSC